LEVTYVRRTLVSFAAIAIAVGPWLAVPERLAGAQANGPVRRQSFSYPSLPDFDIRTTALSAREHLVTRPLPRATNGTAQKAAETALLGDVQGLQIRWSPLTGGPRAIVPTGQAIAGPNNDAPADIARGFIADHRELYGLDDGDVAGLRLVREYETRETGVTHLTFVQEVAGLRVIGADLRIAVDGKGQIVWVGGELVPSANELSKRNGWTLGAAEAAESAARHINAPAAPTIVAEKGGPEANTIVELGTAFTEPAVARRMLFPIAPGVLRPVWNVLLMERGPGNMYVVTVDAEKGSLLARHNLTRYLGGPQTAQFRVFVQDTPQPDLPHISSRPTDVDRLLVPMPAATHEVSPQGWLGNTAISIGNNVRAVEDRDGNNIPGATAAGDANFVFDHALDFPINTGKANTEAAITNLFYWNNLIHDYLYRLGFDEAAGNFQVTNFTGEGRGNDPVNADAQDGSGFNNANFGTPPDGSSPRMQMFLWSGGYDGDFDQTIIIHEYCHGLSTRLIGGPDYVDGLTGPQSGGMGEGWSDWYALTMLTGSQDDVDATYVVGGYATRDFSNGVRNVPYSTNLRTNPLTYQDIDPAQSDLFNDPTEVHNVGTVWCSILWDLRANFIKARGFEQGRSLVERLVTDGMKFSINNPSFTDARDGILIADQVRTGGQNQCLIWQSFARRGVGYSSFTLNGSSTAVKEAFDLPPWCESAGAPAFNRASYDELDSQAVLRLGDADLASQESAAVTVTSTSGDSETLLLEGVDRIPGLFEKSIAINRGAGAQNDGMLNVALGDTVTLSYNDASAGGTKTDTARIVRRAILVNDTLESGAANWKSKQFKLTTEAAASPTHSWTESEGRQYSNESKYTLTLKPAFDLRNSHGTRLAFKHTLATEPGYDLCTVEVKAQGSTWKTIAVFSGYVEEFADVLIDLSEFDGKQKVKIRFVLTTDQLVTDDGWHLDDIAVITGKTQ
jgi:hypothetical protein